MLFVALGGMVGSGWLFGPFYAAKMAGPAAILSWVIGGGLMMIVALTFAELASTFPIAGGTIRFLHLSHGVVASFSMAWVLWLASIAVAPIETMALLQYASHYLPALLLPGPNHLLSDIGILAAAGLMLIMVLLNAYGVKLLSKTNSIVVLLKLSVPILTIIVLLHVSFHFDNITKGPFNPMGWKAILTSLPTTGVIFSFLGYSPAIQLAGEAKNPQRSIPIAVIGALFLAIILYVVLQIVFLVALSPKLIPSNWLTQSLHFSGDAAPFVSISLGLGIIWLVKLLYVDAAVSPFGTALIYTASASRLGFAMKHNGYLPQFFQHLNKHGVPVRMLLLNYLLGLLLFFPFPTWKKLVGFLVSALVFSYAVGPLSLVVLRKTMPEHKRPFRLPCVKLWCLLAFYTCNLIIYWTGWGVVSKVLIAFGIGYIWFFLYRMTRSGRQLDVSWQHSWWIFVYLLLLGLMSYLGIFGGKGVIPFGWDFFVIAVISVVVYIIAYHCRYTTLIE